MEVKHRMKMFELTRENFDWPCEGRYYLTDGVDYMSVEVFDWLTNHDFKVYVEQTPELKEDIRFVIESEDAECEKR